MPQAASRQIVATVGEVLRRHPPFDAMSPEDIARLAARLRLGYYARGSVVTGPDSGVADRLYIVKQGVVRGSPGASASSGDALLGEGDCFPISALVGRRAGSTSYGAETDCFCWELGAADFHELLERSAPFRDFCMGRLAALLGQAQRARRADAAAALAGASMLAPLGAGLARAPVSCSAQATLGEAVAAMRAERVGSMVIVDAQQLPVGIFTTSDLLERAAVGAAAEAPIAGLMTRDPVALEADATLADAALAMARHRIRHVVITRDGRLAGVISERDLFALQRFSLGRVAGRVHAAASLEELKAAAADIREFAHHLLAQGLDAEHLTQLTSALNDGVAQRLIAMAAARHAPPASWCWLALGSEGRLEQTLATDQDNALIFEPAGDAEGARRVLLAFANEVNEGLAACGYPLCKGGIMARNPSWCLTVAEWRERFDGWIRSPQPEALLNASIFFDFRALAGEAALAGELREGVLARARSQPAFLRAMAANALKVRPPLHLLHGIAADDTGPFPGTLDLKGSGARLFVDAARTLALAHAVPATGTVARLRAVAATGGLPAAEAEGSVTAFHVVQGLRLRRQYLEAPPPEGAENRIEPARLNKVDRRILNEALRQAALLQDRLRADYTL
ncbi:MAG: CBS domain-containing protein [Gammaproteobacteria bacterium]|nr:CBS domain-containing protein [Gammaproteobacteria bacterium]